MRDLSRIVLLERGQSYPKRRIRCHKKHEPCFSKKKQGSCAVAIPGKLVPNAAPNLGGINGLIRIQFLGLLKQNVRGLGIGGIRNAAIIHGTYSGALRFVKMADALRAAVMGDHIDVVAHPLPVADMVAFRFRIAASFKDRFVRTFR